MLKGRNEVGGKRRNLTSKTGKRMGKQRKRSRRKRRWRRGRILEHASF